MPPKADPYATKSAWTVDAALILFAVLMIVVVIGTAPRHRANIGATTVPAVPSQMLVASDSSNGR